MLKVVIIEDRVHNLKLLSALVESHNELQLVGTATDVNEGINIIQNTNPNLVLLDIELPSGTGFDILEKIQDHSFKVIFVTTHENYAIKAFQYSAIDYILKPVNKELFYKAVNRTLEVFKKDNQEIQIQTLLNNINFPHKPSEKIILNTLHDIHIIDIKSIVHCEAEESYTYFNLNDKKRILSSKPLKGYEDLLSTHNFIRIHKSHLINLNHLSSLDKKNNLVHLSDGSKVPVSSRKKEYLITQMKEKL